MAKPKRAKASARSERAATASRRPARRGTPDGVKRKAASSSESRTAEFMAAKQREISVSEFFAKNRHLLGFDNPAKALLTTVKELVDNSLDACDEARIPADIEIRIDAISEERFRVSCTDNGPGIVARNVPSVFGKLLYGSKFHRLKMSRGQQGIGVSAAGMYGLLTTGKPVKVTSRTSAKSPAHYFEIAIDTQRNEAAVRVEKQLPEWELPHGTRVEIELEASYRKGQHSVDNYVLQISLANPHAQLRYLPPTRESDADIVTFERVTKELPPETAEIKPHPYGVELGVLMQMLRESKAKNVAVFLASEFSRISSRLAEEIVHTAKLEPGTRPRTLNDTKVQALHGAIAATKIMAPSSDCIAPIGEELLLRALEQIHPGTFTTTLTRKPSVYRGNPFLVEIGLAYGGELPAEDQATMYRFANRVPLQYQQGACAVTRAITSTDWKPYGLQQPKGSMPVGPLVILVHIASVWVPFTSESKEAIAHYPEIIKEIRLGLQECGRKLGIHLRRRRKEADEMKKRGYIQKYIPHVAAALQEILALSDAQRDSTIEILTQTLERSRTL